jgi:hypothetical protein
VISRTRQQTREAVWPRQSGGSIPGSVTSPRFVQQICYLLSAATERFLEPDCCEQLGTGASIPRKSSANNGGRAASSTCGDPYLVCEQVHDYAPRLLLSAVKLLETYEYVSHCSETPSEELEEVGIECHLGSW